MNYLGCMLDESMPGETMALRVIEKIHSRLKFLYRKNWFLDVLLCSLLCNALVQPHFDYVCTPWYPNLSNKLPNFTSLNNCPVELFDSYDESFYYFN